MPDPLREFYIASEYARLIVQYHDEHFPPLTQSAPQLSVSTAEAFEPVPLTLLNPYVEAFLGAKTEVPVQWLLGEYIAANSQEMLSYALMTATNLAEVNEIGAEFIALLSNAVTLNLTYQKNGSSIVSMEARDKSEPTVLFLNDVLLALSLVYFTQSRITDLHYEPTDLIVERFSEIIDFFSATVPGVHMRYQAGHARAEISSGMLNASIQTAESRLKSIFLRELTSKLEKMPSSERWAERVAFFVGSHLEKNVSFDNICDYFCLSRRTMSRLLKNEGSTYSEILDDVRKKRAIELIRGGLAINKVAARAGFNSLLTFNAAFKKWTGVSPSVYRKSHKE